MAEKKTIEQFKEFFITLYVEPNEELFILLGVEHFAYIKHDKDIWTKEEIVENPTHYEGEPKKVHFHLYIKLYKKKTLNGVRKLIFKWNENCSQEHLINVCASAPLSVRYLIHIDDKDKFQYTSSEIKTNLDLNKYFNFVISDNEFIYLVMDNIDNGSCKRFKDIVQLGIFYSKLEFVVDRAYFFKSLL